MFKRLFVFVLSVLTLGQLSAQVQDDFSDGDFSQNPSWVGSDADFIVNASGRLQLDAAVAGQSYLSTSFPQSSLDDQEWRIWVKHSFSGSGNNFTRVYLSSQIDNLSFTGASAAGANGYFLLFGEAGSDDAIRLFRDDEAGSSPTELAAGTAGLVAGSFELFVRVLRDAQGNWEIYTDSGSGDNYQLEATAFDDTYDSSTHLGMVCTYTVSNSDKFQFDDVFFGPPGLDLTPPSVLSLELLSDSELRLVFDEPLDLASAENTNNYSVDGGIGAPISVLLGGANNDEVTLAFTGPFPDGEERNLSLANIEDLAGNAVLPLSLPFTYLDLPSDLFDDFADGDFSSDPLWSGDDSDFVVNAEGELQLDAADAGQSVLRTALAPQSINDKEWRLFIRQEFAGSSSNNTRYYLTANNPDLAFSGSSSAGAEGYFLLFGETGSEDAIRLMRDGEAGSSPVEVCAGSPGLAANPFSLGVKVTRDAAGNWSLFADPSGGELYQFEAAGNDATYTTTSFVGLVCSYTSSNVSAFAFDDLYYGEIVPDEQAPVLLGAAATSANTLRVDFDELLDPLSAENPAAYSVSDGLGNPISALINTENPTQVDLTFANAFPENSNLTLTVENIADPSGNVLAQAQISFIYVVAGVAGPGDVIFNEMMPDPSPPLGLPDAEFVELYNRSDEVFDLNGWTLVNSTTARSLSAAALFPGEHIILCSTSDVALFEPFGQVLGVDSWVALTNSADSLTLLSPDLEVIDLVSYDLSWYGDPALSDGGLSLERVNPLLNCSGAFNWTASQTFQGGTPGQQNSAFDDSPDLTAPSFESFGFFGSTGVLVHFSEPLNAALVDELVYSISPDLGEAQVALIDNSETLRLVFDESFEVGQLYLLSLIGISDCEGNVLPEALELELQRGSIPESGELLITEIMAAPSSAVPGSPNAEYVEIYNRSDQVLELSGLSLEGAALTEFILMEPSSYLVLTRSSDLAEFDPEIPVAGMEGFPTLTNSGRSLSLTLNGEVIDALTYSDSWYKDPSKDDGGYSLELINPNHPCSDIDNWMASQAAEGHTAGAQNSVFSLEPVTTLPALEFVLVEDASTLLLYFDRQLDPASLDALTVDVGTFASGVFSSLNYSLVNAEFTEESRRVLSLEFSGGFSAGLVYHCQVSGVSDCWGNAVSAEAPLMERFGVPEVHEPGDLVINEILFNPFTGGSDFVELYNRSGRVVALNGWFLANESDGLPANFRSISELPYVLFPGDYVVLTRSRFELEPFYPRVERVLEMESLPTYNNGEGVVVLADADLEIIDRVAYTEDMHYPLLREVKGVSLERLNFDRESADESNWHSASEPVGFATPGYENSQLSFALPGGYLSITPEVFSPDNDGFEDQCLISYELPREGFAGSITVYDDLGRLVRRVEHNTLFGTSGTVSWDGFSEDRLKAGVGLYIVFFEAFHPDGEVIREKGVATLGHYLD